MAIALSAAFFSYYSLAFSLAGAVFLGLVVYAVLHFWYNSRLMARALNELKFLVSQPEDFENDLNRRLDDLSRQLEALKSERAGDWPQVAEKLGRKIQTLERDLRKISGGSRGPDIAARPQVVTEQDKVVSLHQKPDGTGRNAGESGAKPVVKQSRSLAGSGRKRNTLSQLLHKAVSQKALELHLQPIVDMQNHHPIYYDTMLRLKDAKGGYFELQDMEKVARAENLSAVLDGQHLFNTIKMLRALDNMNKKAGLFCRISRATLHGAGVFNEFHAVLKANEALAKWLIIEISQSDRNALNSEESQRLSQIADLGYPLALGDLGTFNLDARHLVAAGFRFLKIPADTLLSGSGGIVDAHVPDAFSSDMEKTGLAVIAVEVDNQNQLLDLIYMDVSLGQGPHFALPRPVKAELLQPLDHGVSVAGN